jgi:hypothetical protein
MEQKAQVLFSKPETNEKKPRIPRRSHEDD